MNKLPPLNSKNALSLLAAGVMLAGLTACSSSSSDDNTGGGSTAQSVPVTGTAAKGILLGAKVEACVATNCTGDNDPIATTTTSPDDGSYTLNIPANKTAPRCSVTYQRVVTALRLAQKLIWKKAYPCVLLPPLMPLPPP